MSRRKMLMSVMLMGVVLMFTTSCVQGDLYDDLYEDTDGWFAPRTKKGKDINPELDYARRCLACNTAFCDECVAVAIKNYKGSDLPTVRRTLGPKIYGSNWEVPYMKACQNGGISDAGKVKSAIQEMCGVSPHSISDLNTYLSGISQKDEQGNIYASPDKKIIAQLSGQHWGILTSVVKENGTWYATVSDQTSSGSTTVKCNGNTQGISNVMW